MGGDFGLAPESIPIDFYRRNRASASGLDPKDEARREFSKKVTYNAVTAATDSEDLTMKRSFD